MPTEPPLAQHAARPRLQARARAYPRLLEVGLLATAAAVASCGGNVDGISSTGGVPPFPFGSGGASPALGGAAGAGGTVPTGGSGPAGGTVATGGMETGAIGPMGDIAAPYIDSAVIEQGTDCVGVGAPLRIELTTADDGSVRVTGTRASVPPLPSDCPYFSEDGQCIVPVPIDATLEAGDGWRAQELFAYLPYATCDNTEEYACEMPCNEFTISVDGEYHGSTFCCGHSSNPEYTAQATAAIDELMEMLE